MTLPRYQSYRSTDGGWLDELPTHWAAHSLKRVLARPLQYGANAAADDDTPANPRFVRITDITPSGELREDTFRSLPADIAEPYLLDDGDILLARSGATVGKSFQYSSSWGICCFAGYLIRARANSNIMNPRFLYACCQTDFYWKHVASDQIQATIQNVSAEKYAAIVVPCPPLHEQHAITAFLDRETAKIDALVDEQKRLIELLKEKRQAVISHAVTKGLDPNAPMKDSGVDWLGQVPEHWNTTTVGRVCEFLSYGFTNPMPTKEEGPYLLTANDIDMGSIRYDTARRTSQEAFDNLLTDKSRPQVGDLLLTKDGTLGRVAVHDGSAACINQSVAILRPDREAILSLFLATALSGGVYQGRMIYEAGGSTIKHIYISRLSKMPIAIPKLAEQQSVLVCLASALSPIDQLLGDAKTAVDLLQERRSALISAAVTGKIDVRGVATEIAEAAA